MGVSRICWAQYYDLLLAAFSRVISRLVRDLSTLSTPLFRPESQRSGGLQDAPRTEVYDLLQSDEVYVHPICTSEPQCHASCLSLPAVLKMYRLRHTHPLSRRTPTASLAAATKNEQTGPAQLMSRGWNLFRLRKPHTLRAFRNRELDRGDEWRRLQ